jgi:hypothetical protein
MGKLKAVKIDGDESLILSVTLRDILTCVQNGQDNKWSILYLEATGDLGTKSILDFEEEIKSSKNGVELKWIELLEIAGAFHQIIEILLIGDKDASLLRRYKDDKEMYATCSYTLELVDSSYWIVHSNNDDFLERVKSTLSGAEYIFE